MITFEAHQTALAEYERLLASNDPTAIGDLGMAIMARAAEAMAETKEAHALVVGAVLTELQKVARLLRDDDVSSARAHLTNVMSFLFMTTPAAQLLPADDQREGAVFH